MKTFLKGFFVQILMPVIVSLLIANIYDSPNTVVALEIQICGMPMCHLKNYSYLKTNLCSLISKAKQQKENQNIAKAK